MNYNVLFAALLMSATACNSQWQTPFSEEFAPHEQVSSSLTLDPFLEFRDLDEQIMEAELELLSIRQRVVRQAADTVLLPGGIVADFADLTQAFEDLDLLLDERELLVQGVISSAGVSNPKEMLKASLMTWLLEVRALSGPSAWTWSEWSGERPFPEPMTINPYDPTKCLDPIRNQLFFDIAEAIIYNNKPNYVKALADVERSITCARLYDLVALDGIVTNAYYSSLDRFEGNPTKKQLVRRSILSSITNLLILIHDHSKIVGDFSSSSSSISIGALFESEMLAFKQVFSEPTSVLRQTGLWILDADSNRLVQIGRLCEASTMLSGSACVSGSLLLESLIDARRLGLSNCSAIEMITSEIDPDYGYICQKRACDPDVETSGFLTKDGLDTVTQHGLLLDDLHGFRCSGGGGGGGGASGIGTGALGPTSMFSCASGHIINQLSSKPKSCAIGVLGADTATVFKTIHAPELPSSCDAGDPRMEGAPEQEVQELDEEELEKLNDAKATAQTDLDAASTAITLSAGVADPETTLKSKDFVASADSIANKVTVISNLTCDTGQKDENGNPIMVACAGRTMADGTIYIDATEFRNSTAAEIADILKHEGVHVAFYCSVPA